MKTCCINSGMMLQNWWRECRGDIEKHLERTRPLIIRVTNGIEKLREDCFLCKECGSRRPRNSDAIVGWVWMAFSHCPRKCIRRTSDVTPPTPVWRLLNECWHTKPPWLQLLLNLIDSNKRSTSNVLWITLAWYQMMKISISKMVFVE
jgi:hypothetical protein